MIEYLIPLIPVAYLAAIAAPHLMGEDKRQRQTAPQPRVTVTAPVVERVAPTASPPLPLLPVQRLTSTPALLVFGAQGSGKTTLAHYLIAQRLRAGHEIIVLDPHCPYGHWQGLEVVGRGMDYAAIDEKLTSLMDEIRSRYERLTTVPNCKFRPLTIVAEELTNWASRTENIGHFLVACLSDIRKVDMHLLAISHSRTLQGFGNIKGFAAARDAGLTEVELKATSDFETGKARPSFQGWLKFPGDDPVAISTNETMQFHGDFSTLIAAPQTTPRPGAEAGSGGGSAVEPEPVHEPLEPVQRTLNHAEPGGSAPEPVHEPALNQFSFDPADPTIHPEERGLIVRCIRDGMSWNSILAAIYPSVRKGGSVAYKTAHQKYQSIVNDLGAK